MSNQLQESTVVAAAERAPADAVRPRRLPRSRGRSAPVAVDAALLEQAVALLEYCAGRGSTPSRETFHAVRTAEEAAARESTGRDGAGARPGVVVDDLVRAHRQLAALAYPATPRSVTYLRRMRQAHRTRWTGLLGAVPVVRTLVLLALGTLVLFALLAALPDARESVSGAAAAATEPVAFGDRLLRELFLIVAALLGATFAALYRASSYVLAGTYEPEYTFTYVVRLVLGALAGLLLAEFVPVDDVAGLGALTTPALALVGGFCASVVYAVLQRIVAAVEAIFQGGSEAPAAADIASARAAAVAGAEEQRRQHFERAVEVRESLRTGNVGEAAQRVNLLIESLRTT